MKLKPLTFRKISKRLGVFGFYKIRQKGSHVIFKHVNGKRTVVPNHPGEKIGKGLIKKILRDIDVSVQDFYQDI